MHTQKTCECGCGTPVPLAKRTDAKQGTIRGKPIRFIHGHNGRGKVRGEGLPWSDAKLSEMYLDGATCEDIARAARAMGVVRSRSYIWHKLYAMGIGMRGNSKTKKLAYRNNAAYRERLLQAALKGDYLKQHPELLHKARKKNIRKARRAFIKNCLARRPLRYCQWCAARVERCPSKFNHQHVGCSMSHAALVRHQGPRYDALTGERVGSMIWGGPAR